MTEPTPWSTVIVTGGMGFIGSNLSHRLVKGGCDVHILDAQLPEYGGNKFNIKDIQAEVTCHRIDVRNRSEVMSTFEQIRPEAVFHLAAQLSRTISMSKKSLDIDINCKGTINVLDAVTDHCANADVLFTSSQSVYGIPESLPLTEESQTSPIDIYGANKLAAESYFGLYNQQYNINVTIVRLTNVYGPRAQLANPKYGVINKFIRNALQGETMTVYKPGTMLRDFVYIDDVIEGMLAASRVDSCQDLYLIGSGQSISIKQLANLIKDKANDGEIALVEWPEDWGGIKIGDISVTIDKLQRQTKWKPRIDIKNGLERTIGYYDRHIDKYV